MSLPKVTIQIVTWNGMRYLPECLKSIYDQTYRDFQVLIIDNNSTDGTVEFIRQSYPMAAVYQNKNNVGFARAHNQGLRLLNSELVVVANQDILLESTWLENIITAVTDPTNEQCGSFGGVLFRLSSLNNDLHEVEKSNIVDSCGIAIERNHRVVDRFSGATSDWPTTQEEVFGHSGALVLYRKAALESIALKLQGRPEYFDEDFVSYKEDVDVAWRLQLAGWSALYVPAAVAYHARSVAASTAQLKEIRRLRHQQSRPARYFSYRNHFFVLIKNQTLKQFWPLAAATIWYEFKKFVYLLIWEPRTLRALFSLLKYWPRMSKKRRQIFHHLPAQPARMNRWLTF